MLYSAAYRSLGVLQSAYDFFAPGPLPGYAGNPNNNNGWIEEDVPLLGELGAEVDEQMSVPMIGEIAEPIVEMKDQMIALVIDADEDIAMLFGNDDFSNDDSEGVEEEEVWEVGGPSTAATGGQSFPFSAPGLPIPPSVIEDLSTRLGDLKHRHGQLPKKVIQVSDVDVAAGISIGEIGLRFFAVEG
nr:hypothetical protein [Tanacetum cinerariifolium]